MINKKSLRSLTGLLILLLGVSFANASPIKFYWSETTDWNAPGSNGVVRSANSDGTGQATIASGFNRIDDVELDAVNNHIYWSNWSSGPPGTSAEGIHRSNLNGSSPTQVVAGGIGGGQTNSSTPNASGMHGIALDPNAGEIYFTRGVSYADGNGGPEVSKINMDGSGYTRLNTPDTGWFLNGIDVDPSTGTIYFGSPGVLNTGTGGAVNSVTTLGAQTDNLVPHTDGQGRAIALDAADGILFFSSWDIFNPAAGGGIWSYNLSTLATTLLLFNSEIGIPDLEVDVINNRLYYTEFGTNQLADGAIRSIDYTGANGMTHISDLVNPFGLALEFEPAQVPIPTTLALFGLGLAGLGFARRKKA